MGIPKNGFLIYKNGIFNRIGPVEERERSYHESLIRAYYERCHPDDTLEDLKHRAGFSKEDKGLLRDWMAVAAQLAGAERREKASANERRAAAWSPVPSRLVQKWNTGPLESAMINGAVRRQGP